MPIIENENGLPCYFIRNSVIRLSLVVVYEYLYDKYYPWIGA